jgi:hypothetical protein
MARKYTMSAVLMAKEHRQVLQKQARQDNISKLRQLIEKGKETRNSENQEIEEEK